MYKLQLSFDMALYHCQNSSLPIDIINGNATFNQHPFGHVQSVNLQVFISQVSISFAIRHLTIQELKYLYFATLFIKI